MVLGLLMRFILRSFLRQSRPYLSVSIEIRNMGNRVAIAGKVF